MTRAFWSASRIVQSFSQLELGVFVCLNELLQVIRIYKLPMQVVQNILKSFLRAPHISFLKSFTAKCPHENLLQSISNLLWLYNLFNVIFHVGLLVFLKNIFQIAEQANLRL